MISSFESVPRVDDSSQIKSRAFVDTIEAMRPLDSQAGHVPLNRVHCVRNRFQFTFDMPFVKKDVASVRP